MFANITTPPEEIALTAADYAIAKSDGHAQAAVMRNSETLIGRTKGDLIRKRIEACTGCAVLSFDVIPIVGDLDPGDAAHRQPDAALRRQADLDAGDQRPLFRFRHPGAARRRGRRRPARRCWSRPATAASRPMAASSDGNYQVATVPEPLNLQGWMAIDELNRAFAGATWSGYVTKVHLVTKDNVEQDGGENNRFDPQNGYREHYKAIWGK